MIEALYRVGNMIWALIMSGIESINLIVTGWAQLPGQLEIFAANLGAAGTLLLTVVSLCVGYLVLRLIITVVEIIPGF